MSLHIIKNTLCAALLLFTVASCSNSASNEKIKEAAVYAGGPVYNARETSIDDLKASGFSTLIVWTIHINENADLNLNAEFLLCKDGEYVGAETYPHFASDLERLKTAPTTINRIEIGLSGWGSPTFESIKTLTAQEGVGKTSKLYENFKALKEALPQIDAVNFDDESTYDAQSSTQFAMMLAEMGYKIALCPFEVPNFWTEVANKTNEKYPNSVDAIYLQCYDGGAKNNPCDWKNYFPNIPMIAGLWSDETKDSPEQIGEKLSAWNTQCELDGGFVWLYDTFRNTPLVKELPAIIKESVK